LTPVKFTDPKRIFEQGKAIDAKTLSMTVAVICKNQSGLAFAPARFEAQRTQAVRGGDKYDGWRNKVG
jgi:hypothetical protein